MNGSVEREVKLDVDEGFVVPALDQGDRVGVAVMAPRELDATYFDAVDLRLLDRGITVRRRTGEGTRWTVKLPTDEVAAAGGTAREEVDIEALDVLPPDAVVDLVMPYLEGANLGAVARLVSRRERLHLASPDGVRFGELDDDRVTAHGIDGTLATFREVEVEFGAAADPGLVEWVVERLVEAGARRAPGGSKLERALGLLGLR